MNKKAREHNPSALGAKVESLEKSMQRVELALYGANGTGGMAKDLTDIKGSLKLWGQLKTFGLGIASTVIAALIIAVATGAI